MYLSSFECYIHLKFQEKKVSVLALSQYYYKCKASNEVLAQEVMQSTVKRKCVLTHPVSWWTANQNRRKNKANLSPWCLQSSAESGRLSGALEKHAFILSIKPHWSALMDKGNVSDWSSIYLSIRMKMCIIQF